MRPTPGKRHQFIAGLRHLAAEFVDQHLRKRHDVLRLVAVKADRLDVVAQPLLAERQHLFRRVGHLEERPRRLVDAGIRRLRGERDGYDERERVGVLQLAPRLRPLDREPAEDLLALCLRVRGAARRPSCGG